MSPTTLLLCAIYFVLWWVVLFAVLPWGVRSQDEEGDIMPGSEPGAPARPLLLKKLIATTVVAGIVFALGYTAWVWGLNAYILPPGILSR